MSGLNTELLRHPGLSWVILWYLKVTLDNLQPLDKTHPGISKNADSLVPGAWRWWVLGAEDTQHLSQIWTEQHQRCLHSPGTTSPLDVGFNAPFKAPVDRLATQHVQDNLDAYIRWVLFTKWVAQAWKDVSSNKGAIVRSFKKYGISLPIDESQDSEINIRELSASVLKIQRMKCPQM